MADPYPQDSGPTYSLKDDYDTRGRTRRMGLWLALLALLLIVLAFGQTQIQPYAQKALSKADRLITKSIKRTKEMYACGLSGCMTKSGSITAAKTRPAEVATARVAATAANRAVHSGGEAATPSSVGAESTRQDPVAGITFEPQQPASAPGQATSVADTAHVGNAGNPPVHSVFPPYPPYPEVAKGGPWDAGKPASEASGVAAAAPPVVISPDQAAATQKTAPLPSAKADTTVVKQAAEPPARPEASGSVVSSAPSAAQTKAPAATAPSAMVPQGASSAAPQPTATASIAKGVAVEEEDPLSRARRLAESGRLRASVHEYLFYLARHPQDGNAYGELGNVYMAARRYPEAARNYYEAATRFHDEGQVSVVASLMPVIERYEPMLASLLHRKIARERRQNFR